MKNEVLSCFEVMQMALCFANDNLLKIMCLIVADGPHKFRYINYLLFLS